MSVIEEKKPVDETGRDSADKGDDQDASRKIRFKEGTDITVMRPFVWEVYAEYHRKFCYRCTIDIADHVKLSRCAGCKWAHYCSPKCQKNDWADRHKDECHLLKQPEYHCDAAADDHQCTMAMMILKSILQIKKSPHGSDFYQLYLRDGLTFGPLEGPSTFQYNERVIRMLDPEGTVCRDEADYLRLFRLVAGNQDAMPGFRMNKPEKPVGQIGKRLQASSVDTYLACAGNAMHRRPEFSFSNFWPLAVNVIATRDIYEDEKVYVQMADPFYAKLQKSHVIRGKTIHCPCPTCTDTKYEANRTALLCKTDGCLEAIPNDERADQVCPACGEVNTSRRKAAQSVLVRLGEFQPPPVRETMVKHARHGPMAVMREFIKEGEILLHPTNVLLGKVYLDGANHLAHKKLDHTEEWLEYAVKSLKSLELYAGKYDNLTLEMYAHIMHHYLLKGQVEQAVPYANVYRERNKIPHEPDVPAVARFEDLWDDLMDEPELGVSPSLLAELKSAYTDY